MTNENAFSINKGVNCAQQTEIQMFLWVIRNMPIANWDAKASWSLTKENRKGWIHGTFNILDQLKLIYDYELLRASSHMQVHKLTQHL